MRKKMRKRSRNVNEEGGGWFKTLMMLSENVVLMSKREVKSENGGG
jgi:hypothetical protein